LKKKFFGGIGFYVLLFLVVLLMFGIFNYEPGTSSIVYSELLSNIKSGRVSELVLTDRTATITLRDIEEEYPNANKRIADISSVFLLYEDAGEEIRTQMEAGTLKVETPAPQQMP